MSGEWRNGRDGMSRGKRKVCKRKVSVRRIALRQNDVTAVTSTNKNPFIK